MHDLTAARAELRRLGIMPPGPDLAAEVTPDMDPAQAEGLLVAAHDGLVVVPGACREGSQAYALLLTTLAGRAGAAMPHVVEAWEAKDGPLHVFLSVEGRSRRFAPRVRPGGLDEDALTAMGAFLGLGVRAVWAGRATAFAAVTAAQEEALRARGWRFWGEAPGDAGPVVALRLAAVFDIPSEARDAATATRAFGADGFAPPAAEAWPRGEPFAGLHELGGAHAVLHVRPDWAQGRFSVEAVAATAVADAGAFCDGFARAATAWAAATQATTGRVDAADGTTWLDYDGRRRGLLRRAGGMTRTSRWPSGHDGVPGAVPPRAPARPALAPPGVPVLSLLAAAEVPEPVAGLRSYAASVQRSGKARRVLAGTPVVELLRLPGQDVASAARAEVDAAVAEVAAALHRAGVEGDVGVHLHYAHAAEAPAPGVEDAKVVVGAWMEDAQARAWSEGRLEGLRGVVVGDVAASAMVLAGRPVRTLRLPERTTSAALKAASFAREAAAVEAALGHAPQVHLVRQRPVR